MLDAKFIRENLDTVATALNRRGLRTFDPADFKEKDAQRKTCLKNLEKIRQAKNDISKDIGDLKRKNQDTSELTAQSKGLDDALLAATISAEDAESNIIHLMNLLPNIPDASVPDGLDAIANVKVKQWGNTPSFTFKPKPHWELGKALGILDWERAAKIAGSRFTIYMDLGARLERALINLMLDTHTRKHGYKEVQVPLMVNAASMYGTGQLPKFQDDMFRVNNGYYLIPTAEVPLTNLHRDETLLAAKVPLKYVAYTPCFRSEAGAYGKDTRGMIRQHQFNKVELVKFVQAADSDNEHELLTQQAEHILEMLELPYRRMLLCAGDMGFGARKCFDLEVYSAAQEKQWLECSSCSNFGDFQARRANIKMVFPDGRKEFVHTINGSGLATSRVVPAILENNQQEDGSVNIPKVLWPYMDGLEKICRS